MSLKTSWLIFFRCLFVHILRFVQLVAKDDAPFIFGKLWFMYFHFRMILHCCQTYFYLTIHEHLSLNLIHYFYLGLIVFIFILFLLVQKFYINTYSVSTNFVPNAFTNNLSKTINFISLVLTVFSGDFYFQIKI